MTDQTMSESHDQEFPDDFGLPLYISPILLKLDSKSRPDPSPACETCPSSQWFGTRDQLKCFCRVMHCIVWDGEMDPTMICDGRELALKELQED